MNEINVIHHFGSTSTYHESRSLKAMHTGHKCFDFNLLESGCRSSREHGLIENESI